MKQTKIEVQITKNLGNYETVRIGGEWSVDGDNQQAVYAAAIEQLNAIYAANYLRQPATVEAAPTPATVAEDKPATPDNTGKQVVSFKDNPGLVTKICNRITKGGVTREVIDQYYELDEQASNVIDLALKLAKKVIK